MHACFSRFRVESLTCAYCFFVGRALEIRKGTLTPLGRFGTSVSTQPFRRNQIVPPPSWIPGPRPTVRALELGTATPLISWSVNCCNQYPLNPSLTFLCTS